MSAKSRNKGRRGESEAIAALQDRDWKILADTTAGKATCDLVAECPNGNVYMVEVKNCELLKPRVWASQAVQQAKGKRWLLMCRLPMGGWLVREGGSPDNRGWRVW